MTFMEVVEGGLQICEADMMVHRIPRSRFECPFNICTRRPRLFFRDFESEVQLAVVRCLNARILFRERFVCGSTDAYRYIAVAQPFRDITFLLLVWKLGRLLREHCYTIEYGVNGLSADRRMDQMFFFVSEVSG